MNRHRKLLVAAIVILVILVGIGGFYFLRPDKTAKPVRIGYLPIYVDLPLFVAKEKGFFEKRGVQVELVRFASSPEIGTALVTGSVQFGASIAYSVVLKRRK